MFYALDKMNEELPYDFHFDKHTQTFVCMQPYDPETKRSPQLVVYQAPQTHLREATPPTSQQGEEGEDTAAGRHTPFPITADLLSSRHQTLLTAFPRTFEPGLLETASKYHLRTKPGALCHIWVRPPHAPATARAPAIAGSYTLQPLTQEHAELINDRWTYGGTAATLQFIQLLIRECETLAALDSHGQPVCWALQQVYGAIGMVHTEPGHRRKGLARAVVHALCGRIGAKDELAFAYITDDNAASQALFTQLGFVQGDALDWWHLIPTAKARAEGVLGQREEE